MRTRRLCLVPATAELIDCELGGHEQLARELAAELPEDWPPEHHDAETLRFMRKALEQPDATGWWLHYIVLTESTPSIVVGTAGYKGPPSEGSVEIGYSIVPSRRQRGIATEACGALIEAAWRRGARVVTARTLPDLEASVGVLRKLGFAPAESSEPGVLVFALRRDEPAPDARREQR